MQLQFFLQVIVACYILIVKRVLKTQIRTNAHRSGQEAKRKKIVVLCIALVAVFTICWAPYHAVYLAYIRGIKGEVSVRIVISNVVHVCIVHEVLITAEILCARS